MSDERFAAVVTGGARGIGAAIARQLAGRYPVALWDVEAEAAEALAADLREAGAAARAWRVDVTDLEAVGRSVDEVVEEFGGLEVLVNNAGITRDTLFIRMKPEDWELVLKVNLTGAFNCAKAAARPMMKLQRGHIVNISSVVGLMGNVSQVNYAASKAGMLGLTKSLARELARRNITVNAVAPGFIATEMTRLPEEIIAAWLERVPLGRAGTPEDVAAVVDWLCSPAASYITGQVINIDGGMVM